MRDDMSCVFARIVLPFESSLIIISYLLGTYAVKVSFRWIQVGFLPREITWNRNMNDDDLFI